MQETTVTVPAKELKEMRKAFFMMKGLFEASIEYAERITPTDLSNQKVLVNNLVIGQTKAQQFFDKAKKLENSI